MALVGNLMYLIIEIVKGGGLGDGGKGKFNWQFCMLGPIYSSVSVWLKLIK